VAAGVPRLDAIVGKRLLADLERLTEYLPLAIAVAATAAAFNTGLVTTSYATGKTKAKKFAGGLLGTNLGTVITSYWDKQTTGQAKSDGGIGLNDVWGVLRASSPTCFGRFLERSAQQ
jgi:hypothetical protein